jgi:hypothetical protein
VFTGSTERKALDWLVARGAQVKVSYDTQSTRLHAKAWLFRRASGYSTAYIGSSNLSKLALVDGVEWNVRLSQVGSPDIIEKFDATFETYWESPEYESYEPDRDAARFDRAVAPQQGESLEVRGSGFFGPPAGPEGADRPLRSRTGRARRAPQDGGGAAGLRRRGFERCEWDASHFCGRGSSLPRPTHRPLSI